MYVYINILMEITSKTLFLECVFLSSHVVTNHLKVDELQVLLSVAKQKNNYYLHQRL